MLIVLPFLLAVTATSATNRIYADNFEVEGYCPMGRILSSDIMYPPNQADIRHSVDLRAFQNIWGFATSAGAVPTPWPGVPGSSPVMKNFIREGYVAAEFTTPADLVAGSNGAYKNVSNFSGPNINATISKICGELAPVEIGCFATNFPASDGTLFRWRGGVSNAAYCPLEPATTYYLNIELTDPDATGPHCSANDCWVHVLRQ